MIPYEKKNLMGSFLRFLLDEKNLFDFIEIEKPLSVKIYIFLKRRKL